MDYERYRALFGALSNPSCLSIMQLLLLEPQTISDLSRSLDFAQSRVSHAVSRLVEAGIVECWRGKRRKLYRVKDQVLPLLSSIDHFLDGQYRTLLPVSSSDEAWPSPQWISAAHTVE